MAFKSDINEYLTVVILTYKLESNMSQKSLKIDLWASKAPSGTPGAALGYSRGASDAKIIPEWNNK